MQTIPRVECDIIDTCNLKCKDCGHFAYTYKKNTYSFQNFKDDLNNLRRL